MEKSKSLLKQIQKYTDFYLLPLLYNVKLPEAVHWKIQQAVRKLGFARSGKKKKKSKQTTFSHECLFGNAYYEEYHRVLFHCSCLPPVKNTFKFKSHQAQ